MNGPRLISESLPKVAGKVFSRKYIMLGRLVTRWHDIVGADLADKTQPIKIQVFGKGKNKDTKKKPEATLHIATTTADAMLLHYQKDLILERINRIFGESWINKIRFVPMASNNEGAKHIKKRKKPLSVTEKNYLSGILNNVKDEELEKRLEKLGAAILQEHQENE